jgi:signal peptidase II
MFYFPILEGNYPQWVPFLGGDSYIFFRPVFNIADSSITTGVVTLLLFQRQFFQSHSEDISEKKTNGSEEDVSAPEENTIKEEL